MKLKNLLKMACASALFIGGMIFAPNEAKAQAAYNFTYTEGVTIAEGEDFFLYNIGANMFLTGGMDWGSHATADHGGKVVTIASIGENVYSLYTTYYSENGMSNPGYLTSNAYTDTGANDANWVFTPTTVTGYTNAYTIKNGDSYLYYDKSDTRVQIGASTEDNYSYWLIIPRTARETAGDYTFYIQNTDMNRFWERACWAGCTWANSGVFATGGNADNPCGEKFHATLDFYQNLTTSVPNGKYRLYAQAFWRQDGNGDGPKLYANNDGVTLPLLNANNEGTAENMYGASTSFSQGLYATSVETVVADGTLRVGINITDANQWVIWDNFTLVYLGVDLSAYETEIASLRETLDGLKDEVMQGSIKTQAETALSETESVAQTQTAMEEAIAQLNAAIEAANTSIANYAEANTYLTLSATLDAAGKANYAANETVAAVQADYDARTLGALTSEQKTALDAAIISAAKAQTTEGADMTLALVNPSFENGFTGWTNAGMATQGNTSFEKEGNTYCEKWEPNGTFSVKQELTLLNSGYYRLSAKAKARSVTSAKLFANGSERAITIADETSTYTVEFACDANAGFDFGFEATGTGVGASWICVDDFHLTYVGALPEVTAVTGKMNADVAAAQTTAVNAYNAEKTVTNFNAAQAAIAAAQASVDAYAAANTAITKAKAIKENHNFATAAAIATFEEAISSVETVYNNNTMTTDEANAAGVTLGTAVTGWRGGANGAAVWYIESAFGLNAFDEALYINTWSVEGETDGSGFTVPFFEYWTGDGDSLGANTWTGTLDNLEAGLYEVSVTVRVRAKNGVAATAATGITFGVNDGETVDVTEGTQIGTSQFNLETYTAEGKVYDGKLTVNFNVAADNNISWLSFQNVKYTKVRDLNANDYPAGDMNRDGKVTVSDITTLVNKLGQSPANGDVNGDGSVNAKDVEKLVNIILGKE